MVVALIGAAATVIGGVLVRDVRDTKHQVNKIEISINSRMTALLESTEKAARLAGMAAERQVGAARAADVAVTALEAAEARTPPP